MAAQGKHREAILSNAVQLFRRQGYAATGLADILAASGAPKGSLYHYFPGGKTEIGEKAVERAGETVVATLSDLAAQAAGPEDLVSQYIQRLAGWLSQSGFRDGCPITTTLLETVPEHEPIRLAGAAAFSAWAAIIEASATASGIPADRARPLSRFAITVIEGALIQCRVYGNDEALMEAAGELRRLFEAARAGPAP